ncbi:hypothetical protein F7R25_03930 [Burkholderia stagnalis]|uniref:Uncharacterized protein n=1 Tax=Burkholderia stagnalis TaxID=1503054 RepID=A0A6L3N3Z6_9BURK|nr:hypothetical protein [Burkholderia stagnalis]KAB0640654.1 hypothetical protein F7R25_03930 [Burkholderia stagnalis]VWB06054.1 hypothetical protein BST28156_00099 [Burkholderia stagnalis]
MNLKQKLLGIFNDEDIIDNGKRKWISFQYTVKEIEDYYSKYFPATLHVAGIDGFVSTYDKRPLRSHLKDYSNEDAFSILQNIGIFMKKKELLKAKKYPYYTDEPTNLPMDYVLEDKSLIDEEGNFLGDLDTTIRINILQNSCMKYGARRFCENSEVLLAILCQGELRNTFEWHFRKYDFMDDEWFVEKYRDGSYYTCDKEEIIDFMIKNLIPIVEFEKPIVALYEQAREAIIENNLDAYLPHSVAIEEVLQDPEKEKVFLQCVDADKEYQGVETAKGLEEFRKKAHANKLDNELPTKADNNKTRGKI